MLVGGVDRVFAPIAANVGRRRRRDGRLKAQPCARIALFAPTDGVYGVARMLITHAEIAGVENVAMFLVNSPAIEW
jgi:hypothetical protein